VEPDRRPDLYAAVGGIDACRALAAAFYGRVEGDPVLRPLFSRRFEYAGESLAAFIAHFLGGPSQYPQRRWWLSLRESHLRFAIGERERRAWLGSMRAALDEVGTGEPARGALLDLFERSSAHLVNRGAAATPSGPERPGPAHREIEWRWEAHRALEEAVAAVRARDAGRALALLDGRRLRTWFEHDRAALVGLLALMAGSDDAALVARVEQEVRRDPALVEDRYWAGRTLLHGVAAAGSPALVDFLLGLGVDPGAADLAGHTPLHCVSNECRHALGGEVVRALAGAGADVNARDRAKRCTPLHLAARRGTTAIGEALLDHGADIEARDRLGDTPLRRAVNCGQPDMVGLLLSRGADAGSRGSRGLTPAQAARTDAVRRLLA
jgi:hemoglobin